MSDSPTPKAPLLEFETYNGMSRPAMFWSIPIMPMMGLIMSALIVGVISTALLSWVWALVLVFPFAIALLALRLMCSIDGQYLRRVRFALRRLKLNLRYGKALLLTPFNPKWSQFYGQRYSQQRYAGRRDDSVAQVPSGRVHHIDGGQPTGQPDPVQGDRAPDA